MAVEIKRKPNENTYSLLRRFQERIRKGRVLAMAKKSFYYERPKNKRQLKEEALRRLYNRRRREYLIKIGKIVEEPVGQGQNNRFKKGS